MVRSSKILFPNVRAPLNYFLPTTLFALFHFYSFHTGFRPLLYSWPVRITLFLQLLMSFGWEVLDWMVKYIFILVQFGLEVLNRFKFVSNTKYQEKIRNQQDKITISSNQFIVNRLSCIRCMLSMPNIGYYGEKDRSLVNDK